MVEAERRSGTTRRSLASLCLVLTSQWCLWIVPELGMVFWRCGMRTEVVPHSMTALFIRLHAATTMCTKTAVAASGMPFMALLPWSVGPSMRTGNRSMKMTNFKHLQWRRYATSLLLPGTPSRKRDQSQSVSRQTEKNIDHRAGIPGNGYACLHISVQAR